MKSKKLRGKLNGLTNKVLRQMLVGEYNFVIDPNVRWHKSVGVDALVAQIEINNVNVDKIIRKYKKVQDEKRM